MKSFSHNKGFTLIEILVAIAIIALLAGIGVVAFSEARKAAKKHMTSTSIHMIASGAEMFKNDFGVFPPSELGGTVSVSGVSKYENFSNLGLPANTSGYGLGSGTNEINAGAEIICALLTGYANDISTMGTFANWITDDGAKGFGFRNIPRGKVRGPYGGAEAAKTDYTAADPSSGNNNSPKVFVDSWGHAILYYRYDSTNSRYNQSDNSSVDVQGAASPCPSGNIDSKYSDARKDFLIVSPGDVDSTFEWNKAITNASVD